MPIEFIDTLNNQDSAKRYALVDLDDLHLDKENPRFSSSTIIGNKREIRQSEIIKYLLQYGNIAALAESINKNHGLYDEEWISCYKNAQNEIIVLEGNRRVTACKVLKDEFLVPESLQTELCIPSVDRVKTLPNICKLKIVLYEREQDAQNYIAAKHTKPEIKKWEPIEQCNYYYDQFIKGIQPIQISTKVGEDVKRIREKIKQFGLFKDVFDVVNSKYADILIENINILPLVTKFFPPLIAKNGKVGLNLNFDQEKMEYYPACEKEYVYKEILLKIGESFFVRPKLPKGISVSERSMTDIYRISTDEIKSKNKVEELIINNVRIPELYSLIQEYRKKDVGYDNKDDDRRARNENSTISNNQKEDSQNEGLSNQQDRSVEYSPSNNREKEFFSDIEYKHINKTEYIGVVLVCEEIKKISLYNGGAGYKQFPIATAFLVRSLIEQILSTRLKEVGRYDDLEKKLKDGSIRSPELGKMVDIFLKDYQNGNLSLFWNDGILGKEFNKCFSGYGTKDQLDTIIHNPHLIRPEQNFLNSLANQGLKLTLQMFLNHF